MIKNGFILLLLAFVFGCKSPSSDDMKHQYTNDLINETSPYLLQHAHNPVNWKPWGEQALAEAREQNKLVLISVGYAACHWCHVMERESFEDSLVAKVMNANFVNIKVDREERPDVDQVYMSAVQLMTGRGGWPLNVIALPDGRPVWGGTYFKKEQWIAALEQINSLYKDNPERLEEYASKLEEGIKSMDVIGLNTAEEEFTVERIEPVIDEWFLRLDTIRGGSKGAPKFMMPTNLNYLLRYAYQLDDERLMNYVNTSLRNMAYGGVYDHIGGGFARYSVDDRWHVPHFEKMLYDNAQLVSLYSDAYLLTQNPLYKEVVEETLDYVAREMTDRDGSFFSSLDADSETTEGELEEGTFYVWTETELKRELKEDFELFQAYYNINDYGLWEDGNYVLIRTKSDSVIAQEAGISEEDLRSKKENWKRTLYVTREKRIRPRLDDKALTSWNALMLNAYLDAYRVFGNEAYLKTAMKNADFILSKQLREDGGLNHSYKDGKSSINGYLEDYAATTEAFLNMYETTLDQKWLNHARNLVNYCFDHFYDDNSRLFFFTSDEDPSLIARQMEFRDNVIPASNSIMAKCLFKLSHYFDNEAYMETSRTMLNNVMEELLQYPSAYSNWLELYLNYSNSFYEVAIVGEQAEEKIDEMNRYYLPNKILVGSDTESELPLLKNRYVDGRTLIYVCVNKACKLPVSEVSESLKLISKK